jgi:hypothetical protein
MPKMTKKITVHNIMKHLDGLATQMIKSSGKTTQRVYRKQQIQRIQLESKQYRRYLKAGSGQMKAHFLQYLNYKFMPIFVYLSNCYHAQLSNVKSAYQLPLNAANLKLLRAIAKQLLELIKLLKACETSEMPTQVLLNAFFQQTCFNPSLNRVQVPVIILALQKHLRKHRSHDYKMIKTAISAAMSKTNEGMNQPSPSTKIDYTTINSSDTITAATKQFLKSLNLTSESLRVDPYYSSVVLPYLKITATEEDVIISNSFSMH